ncbi:hypothetical protein ACRRTK_004325 [Alexandromys fortis]
MQVKEDKVANEKQEREVENQQQQHMNYGCQNSDYLGVGGKYSATGHGIFGKKTSHLTQNEATGKQWQKSSSGATSPERSKKDRKAQEEKNTTISVLFCSPNKEVLGNSASKEVYEAETSGVRMEDSIAECNVSLGKRRLPQLQLSSSEHQQTSSREEDISKELFIQFRL